MRHSPGARVGTALRTLLLALTIALVAPAVCAVPALAGPPDPTISLADLEAKLAGGPMDGYFLTVVGGASQDPQQIPVTLLAVAPGQTLDGALILFEASGAVIDKAGGVASGMSGSPIYVDDGGVYKLAGAVAYGPEGGSTLGMAQPIEYMAAMQADFPPQSVTLTLPRPVTAAGRTLSKVTITPSRRAARRVRPDPGTMVMAPLTTVTVGGLPAASPAFRKAAARLAADGLDAVPGGTAGAGGGDFQTAFAPGVSIAGMYMTGDGWGGSFGTTTYVDGDVVVGFGHPLNGVGDAGFDLCNAFVAGVWSGLFGPEKIFAPGALAGTVTQDRSAGIAGRLDVAPLQVPITSTITFAGRTTGSHSAMPQWAIDSPDWSWYADVGPWAAMLMATRQDYLVGSASTTTEVVVSDGADDYTVTLDNLWDDDYDVISSATGDLDTVLDALTVNQDGIAAATIESVAFSADLSPVHRGARILDVSVPGGLRTGVNRVRTTILRYGDPQPRTVTTDLTIPRGMVRSGSLWVSGPGGADWSDGEDEGADSTGPQTVADIVADLRSAPRNTDLQVVYAPERPLVVPPPAVYPIAEVGASTRTTSALTGYVEKSTGAMSLRAPAVVRRGASARLRGVIYSVAGNTTVSIYRRVAGGTKYVFVAKVPAVMDDDFEARFSFRTGALKADTRFKAVWGGDEQSLGATASRLVRVAVLPR